LKHEQFLKSLVKKPYRGRVGLLLVPFALVLNFAFALPAAAEDSYGETQTSSTQLFNTLPGKALGGRLFPPFELSVGAESGFEEGFLGFNFNKKVAQSDYNGNAHYFTGNIFLDLVYGVLETGPVIGFSDWGDTEIRPGIEEIFAWDFSLFAKFPIILNRRFTFSPLAGMRYRYGLSDNLEDSGQPRFDFGPRNADSLWMLLGGGFDANLTRRVYLRGEILYSNRLWSRYGDALMDTGNYDKIVEAGPELRLAVGVRLGKLSRLPEVDTPDTISVHRIYFEGFSDKITDPNAKKIFSEIRDELKGHPEYSVLIDGNANPITHTAIESAELTKLSRRRAYRVADELTSYYGVDPKQISIFVLAGKRTGAAGGGKPNRVAEIKVVRSATQPQGEYEFKGDIN